jgi:hemerythrin superfamily protein
LKVSTANQIRGGGVVDPIKLLMKQHREVEGFFKQIEKTEDSDERKKLMAEIKHALELHTRLEEEIFYPAWKPKRRRTWCSRPTRSITW